MARDIEEFLRRAAERRKQQQQKHQQPAEPPKSRRVVEAAEIEIVEPLEVVQPVKPRPTRQVRKTKIIQKPRKRKSLRDQSVSEHVRQHIDTSDVSDHADHLGERIQRADDIIDQRIHRKFDHDVGQLDDMPSVQDDQVAKVEEEKASRIAVDLIEMLSKPESVRQAILISEILNRPNFD